MVKKITTEEFIEKARIVHGDKYDYSKVVYTNNYSKVCIICHEIDPITGKEHGEFWQVPSSHLSKRGCLKCAGKGFTIDDYIERAQIIHDNKYDYSKVEVRTITEKACIICHEIDPITGKEHGEFWQTLNNHINTKQGCPMCAGVGKMNTETFVEKAKIICREKNYDFSKVEYRGNKEKVCIICHEIDPITGKEHGEFWIKPNGLFSGDRCSKCSKKYQYSTEEWVERAKIIRGEKYDFSKVNYINNHTKIKLICPEHGEFEIKPNNFIDQQYGCPFCKKNHLEEKMVSILNEIGVKYIRLVKFGWLGRQSLDFYLPEYNIAIECQGIQHFETIDFFGGEEKLKYMKELDQRKKQLCEENGIKLLYYIEHKNYKHLSDNIKEFLENETTN